MSYDYQEERKKIFTEEGQELFLSIRDHVAGLLKQAGAFRMEEVISAWDRGGRRRKMACVDRMVELGEIQEVTPERDQFPAVTHHQHIQRIFVSR